MQCTIQFSVAADTLTMSEHLKETRHQWFIRFLTSASQDLYIIKEVQSVETVRHCIDFCMILYKHTDYIETLFYMWTKFIIIS
jgi:hypothetical protein